VNPSRSSIGTIWRIEGGLAACRFLPGADGHRRLFVHDGNAIATLDLRVGK
jgi:hypothetical protein